MKPQRITREAVAEAAIKATALERSLGIIERPADPIPAGYRPREDWEKIWGCNQTSASSRIRQHLAAGRMISKKLLVHDVAGRRQRKPFFKAIK